MIFFDRLHIMVHLGTHVGKALDAVRKAEYARLCDKDRRFINGQKYALLSHRENLSLAASSSLAHTACATRTIYAWKCSPACCPSCEIG